MSYLKGEVSVAGGQGTAVRMLGSFLFDRDAWGYRCLEKFARFLSKDLIGFMMMHST